MAGREHIVVAQPGAAGHVPALEHLTPGATWTMLPPGGPGWDLDPELAARTTILFADHPPARVASMTALRWIQLGSHGYAQFAGLTMAAPVTVTNASGVGDSPIAQWCVLMLLALSRDLPGMLAAQAEHRWDRSAAFQTEITGRRVGVLGYGNIGREVTRHMHALGLEVWVMSRSGAASRGPRFDPLTRDASGWTRPDRSFTLDCAAEFYRGLDALVVALPISSGTAGLVDAKALSLLRPGAILLNPARARVVDEQALLAALRSGQLAGCALDDHYRQPMPSGDPFFDTPHTIVSAHISGSTASTFFEQRIWQLFADNLARHSRGEQLLNVIARGDLELAGDG